MPNQAAVKLKQKVFQLRPAVVAHRFAVVISALAPQLKPKLQTTVIRSFYSILSATLKNEDSAFLNYGYASLDCNDAGPELDPNDEPDRYSIQLYSRVAQARALAGKKVIEIGCGRGGGAAYVARYLHPVTMTGIDLSARAVRHCRRTHRIEGLEFLRAEADHLPFPPEVFDVALNVESSHCYPSFENFIAEVARVLREGGVFLFADLRLREEVERLRGQLETRFTIVEEEFITANVVRALELDSDRRNQLIRKRAPGFLHKGLQAFASVHGSSTFEAFASGALQYVRFVMVKKAGQGRRETAPFPAEQGGASGASWTTHGRVRYGLNISC